MTLFTSDIKENTSRALKPAFIYLLISILCALFGAIYEVFSHEVYSFYMIYAFAFPLVGGTLPFFILNLVHVKKYPDVLTRNFYHSGIATLTVGSIMRGVLDIYGTTNELLNYYWKIGILLLILSVIAFLIQCAYRNESSN